MFVGGGWWWRVLKWSSGSIIEWEEEAERRGGGREEGRWRDALYMANDEATKARWPMLLPTTSTLEPDDMPCPIRTDGDRAWIQTSIIGACIMSQAWGEGMVDKIQCHRCMPDRRCIFIDSNGTAG